MKNDDILLSPNEKRVLSLMRDGKTRTTREIIIKAKVTDAGREVRRLIDKGFNFMREWQNDNGHRFLLWTLKI